MNCPLHEIIITYTINKKTSPVGEENRIVYLKYIKKSQQMLRFT